MVKLRIAQVRGMNKRLQRRLTCGRVRTRGRFSAKTVRIGHREHNLSISSDKSECRKRSLTRWEATIMSRSRVSSRRLANKKRKHSESKSSPNKEARLKFGSQMHRPLQEAKMSSIVLRLLRRIWIILRRIGGRLKDLVGKNRSNLIRKFSPLKHLVSQAKFWKRRAVGIHRIKGRFK